ncbi:unannotated protein [freshwater metagenome]|uniref:Unannotated protein n=1 Tax=freshwater metagenome TaxID=449393 RepID=A0A6J6JCT5_9ZZZZ
MTGPIAKPMYGATENTLAASARRHSLTHDMIVDSIAINIAACAPPRTKRKMTRVSTLGAYAISAMLSAPRTALHIITRTAPNRASLGFIHGRTKIAETAWIATTTPIAMSDPPSESFTNTGRSGSVMPMPTKNIKAKSKIKKKGRVTRRSTSTGGPAVFSVVTTHAIQCS